MLQTELGRTDTVLAALQQRRPDVAAHCRRVSAFAVRLATQFGLAEDVIETVRIGALLHDVGKLVTPGRILAKPGRPNAREWQELKAHPELGMEMCHRSGFDDDVCAIVLHHHERIDGKGYPDRLAHPSIPFTARLVSVMDAFDALTTPRTYRERLSIEAARTLIARGAGTRFCPWMVTGFLALPPAMLTPGAGEATEVRRHSGGQVFLSADALASLRHTGPSSFQPSLS